MSNAGNAVTTTAVPIAVARAVPTNKLKSMHRRVKVPPTPKKTGFVFVNEKQSRKRENDGYSRLQMQHSAAG